MSGLVDPTQSATKDDVVIRLDGVEKRFGAFVAVAGVSLDIKRGEIFSLLGGSGCGKSTLLRMIAGFEQPTAGRIFIDGVDMTGVPPYERPVNMMFQSYALFPHMTVAQNVAFGLKQDRLPRAEIARRTEDALAQVKMSDFAQRKPDQLSGGQRQRAALARSLAKRPTVLLLDEPLGALDKKLRESTQFELINLQDSLGITFVIVTHDQDEAMGMSCRVGVMNAGRIQQIGAPEDIYEYPANRFVADFVGAVNIFEATLAEDLPDRAAFDCLELGGRVQVGHGVVGVPGQSFWLAVRPEKIRLSKNGPPPGAVNVFSGVVEQTAYLGDHSIHHIRLPSGRLVKAAAPNLERWSEDALTWDDPVHIGWGDAAAVVLSQ